MENTKPTIEQGAVPGRPVKWKFVLRLISGLLTFICVFVIALWLLFSMDIVGITDVNRIVAAIIVSYIIAVIVMRSINRRRKV